MSTCTALAPPAFEPQTPFDEGNVLVFEHCIRYVESRLPRAIVLENVPRITSRGGTWHAEVIRRLEAAGYTVFQRVLSPDQYGCPQSRPCLF